MRKQLRHLAVFTCLTAATAFGSQAAIAASSAPSDQGAVNCGDHKGTHHRGAHFLRRLAKQLGLSEQQKSQAKAILKSSRADNKPLFAAMMKERHQMRTLMLTGNADEAAIRAQAARIAAVEADLAVKTAQEAKQLLALLTPDQVVKLKEIMNKREQRFQQFISAPPME